MNYAQEDDHHELLHTSELCSDVLAECWYGWSKERGGGKWEMSLLLKGSSSTYSGAC
jgi:hypothetical protein